MVEIRVLGPLELVAEGTVIPLGAPMQRRLLAALVIHPGKTFSTDSLIDALWNESPPPSAAKLLQVYVSQLRKALPAPARIRTEAGGYALELEPELLDAARFERLLGEGRSALQEGNAALASSLLRRGLTLWRGQAYGELAYEEFARPEAERLEELRLVALETRLSAELELGRHAEVLPEVLRLAAAEPLRERPQALAMLALYRSGRHPEALDLYTRTHARLRNELGLEPGRELRELQQRILRHDPELAGPPKEEARRTALPAALNALIGRDRELGELRELLTRDSVRMVVLTGAGGSGKSRLALEEAHEAAPSFANGAAFVSLAPLRDPALVVDTIRQALGIAETPGDPLKTLAAALEPQELLLVVDNVEHLRPATPSFVELLTSCPRLTLLITSRVVLHLSGEHVYPVEPLSDDESVALFVQRAHEADLRFRIEPADEELVRGICTRLDRLPLAIELAASRIRSLSPAELLDKLDARLPLLTGGPQDLPARQQTLAATMDWSYRLLAEPQRAMLRRLAVFAGDFDVQTAHAICAFGEGISAFDAISHLIEHSLVVPADERDVPRYRLLETVREYAAERLTEAGEADAVRTRHVRFYLDTAERAEGELFGPEHGNALERLRAENDNLRAAIEWAIADGRPDEALRLTGALGLFWHIHARYREGHHVLVQALALPGGSDTVRAKALWTLAFIAAFMGEFEEASRYGRQSLELAKSAAATGIAGRALFLIGGNEVFGNAEVAATLLDEAIDLASTADDSWCTLEALHMRGYADLVRGEPIRARERFSRCLIRARELQDRQHTGMALYDLGLTAYRL